MNQLCSICTHQYHHLYNPSYLICHRQHILCILCYQQLQNQANFQCPICRCLNLDPIILQFIPQNLCDEQLGQEQFQYLRQIRQEKLEIIKRISQLLDFEREQNIVYDQVRMFLESSALLSMQSNDFYSSLYILKEIIENYSSFEYYQEFLGLGSIAEEEGLSQNVNYEWYQKKYGSYLSLFDMFGISMLKAEASHEEKIHLVQSMYSKHPKNNRILYYVGVAFLNAHFYAKAEQIFSTVIKKDQSLKKIYLMTAYIHLQKRQMQSVEKYTRLYLQYDPQNITARLLNAAALDTLHSFDYSRIRQILQIQPTYAKALLLQAEIDPPSCIPNFYTSCIQMNKHFIQPYIQLGILKISEKQLDQAKIIFFQLLTQKILTNGQNFICIRSLGRIYHLNGCYDLALRLYKEAQKYPHKQTDILFIYIVQLYHWQGFNQSAIQHGESLVKAIEQSMRQVDQKQYQYLKQKIFQIYHILGQLYFQESMYLQAIDLLKNWEQYSTENNALYNQVITIKNQHQSKDRKSSLKWFNCCLCLNYRVGESSLQLVKLLYSRKQYQDALDIIYKCQNAIMPTSFRNRLDYYQKKILNQIKRSNIKGEKAIFDFQNDSIYSETAEEERMATLEEQQQ